MPEELRQTRSDLEQKFCQDDFISLRDILIMILRHRRAIVIFVFVVTLATAIFNLLKPRQYQAEGYLQIIAPVSPEGRVDKDLFETMTVSHLQRVSSAFLAKNVASVLAKEGFVITPLKLEKRINITRPPKTDLIRLVAREDSPDKAVTIVRQWIRQYLESIQKNNIRTALAQVRLLLKQAQSDTMERQAAVDRLQERLSATEPLITIAKSVDDTQLWRDLAQKQGMEAEQLQRLSQIQLKGQEQNTEYVPAKMALMNAEQLLATFQARRQFYNEVERMLEFRANANGSGMTAPVVSTNALDIYNTEADLYVKTLLKSSEIVQFGEPGLLSDSRGALKNTLVVFFAALFLACGCAFICEWGRGILKA